MRKKGLMFVAAMLALVVMTVPAIALAEGRSQSDGNSIPRYNHIFEVVLENHSYSQIIGNANAPVINHLAQQYGLATDYYGVTHPSEPNYVALVGGNYFGIQDDSAYNLPDHTINQDSLAQQLEHAGLSWKAYEQSLPYPGYAGTSFANSLYRSKHNGFLNFAAVQNSPTEMQKSVPDTQLFVDLATNKVPNFSLIIPDQCHDMHGTSDCPDDTSRIQSGDAYTSSVVTTIMASQTWREGNNAIVITFDEGNTNAGCCSAGTNGGPGNLDSGTGGGGQVVTIVITNHGPRGVQDPTPYNHYSLLRTEEDAFGLGCLQHTCDSDVTPMTPLFTLGNHGDHGHFPH